jgi:MerR family transcriptional regulator/heat shock protein HspR
MMFRRDDEAWKIAGSGWDEPSYVISVASKMVGLPPQTLRYYERTGLLDPSRSPGNIRLYSPREVDRIRQIKTLMTDMGVNLAGVEVALRLMSQIEEANEIVRHLNAELDCRQDRLNQSRETVQAVLDPEHSESSQSGEGY